VTEAEWLACTNPEKMLGFLTGKASARKFRLFACACARRIGSIVADEGLDIALLAAETDATDGAPDEQGLWTAEGVMSQRLDGTTGEEYWLLRHVLGLAESERDWKEGRLQYQPDSMRVARHTTWEVVRLLARTVTKGGERSRAKAAERRAHCDLLREIIGGSPLRPLPSPLPNVLAWNDGTVRRIAEGIYEERAFDRLPILADALLDAGCDHEELIAHCRGAGPHVRGCWAVDLILGKS
jgi:hypothetical protein